MTWNSWDTRFTSAFWCSKFVSTGGLHLGKFNRGDFRLSIFIFGIKLFLFRTVPLSIITSFSLHTAVHTGLLCVQWKTLDDGRRNSPKHVEFYSKNKFEKLLHLVGFIIRIYHDARSPERQTLPDKTTLTTERHPCPLRYSNPQFR